MKHNSGTACESEAIGERLTRQSAAITTWLWRKLKLSYFLQPVSDEIYLKLVYRSRFGKSLDLKNPLTFSEKLQWLKINDRNPLYTQLVDKYEVKEWVADKISEDYIVPTLGVWDSFEDIDLSALPERFVLKCTHDSGGIAICDDRSTFDVRSARNKINRSLSRNFYRNGREWPYRDVPPRVLAEVYFPTWTPPGAQRSAQAFDVDAESTRGLELRAANKDSVVDYKFYCFHGEPRFLYVSQGLHDHSTARMIFLSCDWKPMGFKRSDYRDFQDIPPEPSSLDHMLEVARTLSADIPFVRVDLFEHCGQVLFSEMTFHPVSGLMPIQPASADKEIGKMLDIAQVGESP